MNFILIILFIYIFNNPVSSESFYNINGFYGERDSGMGGAYTAISDDASGMFYNPAGLGFSFHDTITTSSVNYNSTEKSFRDVLGPSSVFGSSQNYVRDSRGFNPSFIGVMKSFDKLKLGFAIFNPITERFDQFNNSYQPLYQPGIAEFRIKYTEDNSKYIFGPSIAYNLGNNFSIGGSLLGFDDKTRVLSSLSLTLDNGRFVNENSNYQRFSTGIIPVLGIQYMPAEKVSLGLSIRRTFNLNGTERRLTQEIQGANLLARNVNVEDSSHNSYGAYYGISSTFDRAPVTLSGNPNFIGKIPETHEIRGGIAFYPSPKLLVAMDAIYTSSYQLKENLFRADYVKKYLVISNFEHSNLRTNETLNYACGLEYYITEFISLRLGTFSNKANTSRFSNSETIKLLLAEGILRSLGNENTRPDQISTDFLSTTGVTFDSALGSLVLELPSLSAADFRNEHVNLQGFSLGISYETSKTSIGITFVRQSGGGRGRLTSVVTNDLLYSSDTVYLISTIKN